jgi:hypothetical protein
MTEFSLTCANHPDRATTLRCNRCEKPICSQCAILTPVGYRCRECVRGQQAIFETAQRRDVPLAFVIAAICVAVAAALLSFLAYWGLIAAPVVGGGIAEIVRWATGRRRSRHLPLAAAVGGALGALSLAALPIASAALLSGGGAAGIALTGVIWPLAIGALTTGTMYYRLRGIRI